MLRSLRKHFDPGSIVVIVLTFVLFAVALFIKGIGHGLLLETAVFLVSLKLILMSHRNSELAQEMQKRLEAIYEILRSRQHSH
jgi:hypothetical protein